MLYIPPEPWSQEVSGDVKYSVVKTSVIHLDGLAFLVQQQVRDFREDRGYPYYYIAVRGIVTGQFQRENGNGPETVYSLEPADKKYGRGLRDLLIKTNFRGDVEFSQFPSRQ